MRTSHDAEVALAKLCLEDVLWLARNDLVAGDEVKRYFSLLGDSYVSGEPWADLAKLNPGTHQFEDSLAMLIQTMASAKPSDPVAVFDYLFLRDLPSTHPNATAELYRVMDIVSSVGAPPSLEWTVFLWPTNPHREEPQGDEILFEKIVSNVRSRAR